MKSFFLKVTFILTFVLLCLVLKAQISISDAIRKMPTESVPFNATKETPFSSVWGYGIINPSNIIPDKLYDNVQLTEYSNASEDPYANGVCFRKFTISASNNTLLVISFGGVSPYRTDVLCVVNPNGTIVSTLEGTIIGVDAYIKQFRINAQNQIIVTTIHPVTTTSIPFTTFTSFVGYRKDITYSVNTQGQFIQNSSVTYKSKTYTRSYLEKEEINLWEGGETPI